jgi:hypothetical protein
LAPGKVALAPGKGLLGTGKGLLGTGESLLGIGKGLLGTGKILLRHREPAQWCPKTFPCHREKSSRAMARFFLIQRAVAGKTLAV